ncbi:DUF1367 family protein [Solimonas marina]|uniref:DUF1367 family protein n=1 Tax=Solimonas marina TaxID=2714601 RepID=A0A969W8Q8_9GAMM|nr:DUF1367 family protein [Solimonas marina]NKF21558.1 DUF1367 family protein [Solimonas marina]
MTKRAADAVYARVTDDGSFVAADQISRNHLRRKRIRRNALVRLVVSQPRDYSQWKKAHGLGTYMAINLDDFDQFVMENGKVDSHGALKKLQALSGVECDEYTVTVEGGMQAIVRVPRSLAFDEMDETMFQAAYKGFCDYLIRTYWHDLEQWQIEEASRLVGSGS